MVGALIELVQLLVVMVVAWLCAGLIAKAKFFKMLPELTEQGRFSTLDGLRGFLALAVFCHHVTIHRNFLSSGAWIAPVGTVMRNAGPIPVQLFFMITGFLFWGQAIRAGGKVQWRELAISRVARIAPLYLCAICLTIFLAANSVGFRLDLNPIEASHALIRVLTFGALNLQFMGEIDLMPFNAGVTWTLVYEWAFYAVLPLIALFATSKRFVVISIAFLAVFALHHSYEVQQSVFFLFGMAAAQLKQSYPDYEPAASPAASWAVALLLLCAFLQRGLDTTVVGLAYLFPAFLLVVYGNPMFGLLTTTSARLLGACSYSIYLVHGLFLYVLLHFVVGSRNVIAMQPMVYWGMIFVSVALLVGLCALTFQFIEHPSIEAGKRLRRAKSSS